MLAESKGGTVMNRPKEAGMQSKDESSKGDFDRRIAAGVPSISGVYSFRRSNSGNSIEINYFPRHFTEFIQAGLVAVSPRRSIKNHLQHAEEVCACQPPITLLSGELLSPETSGK
jgi:hypothetical protein